LADEDLNVRQAEWIALLPVACVFPWAQEEEGDGDHIGNGYGGFSATVGETPARMCRTTWIGTGLTRYSYAALSENPGDFLFEQKLCIASMSQEKDSKKMFLTFPVSCSQYYYLN
jgi:hypothetical protein